MKTSSIAIFAGLAVAALAASASASASAQNYSGGRQGPNGHGYSYDVNKTGSTVTGSVQTNGGYGASVNHTGGVNAYGARVGTTTVSTNNGTSVTTRAAAKNGAAVGTVTATGPAGKTAHAGGAVYIPY